MDQQNNTTYRLDSKSDQVVHTYLDYLYSFDYKEKPPTVKQFINEKKYLGSSLMNGVGESMLFPVWHENIEDMFRDNRFVQIVLTGSIGCGKSTAAIVAVAFVMCQLLCLKNPWQYFKLAPSAKMGISFFNLTKTLSESRGFSKLQSFLVRSPWFREHATTISERVGNEKMDFDLFRYVLASPEARGFSIIGEDIVCSLMDEIDSPSETPGRKLKVLQAYEATVRRFESRFITNGASIGRQFLVASKQEELSFLNAFVTKMKDTGKIKVYDVKLWEAKPKENYSGVKFKVAHGDAFHTPKIIDVKDVESYVNDGYQIMDVPIEYIEDFKLDIVSALRDIAGISVAGVRKRKFFSSENFISDCFDPMRRDPVKLETINIGLKDDVRLIHYLDLDAIRTSRNIPRCAHMDFGLTHDALALAMSACIGQKEVTREREDGTLSIQKEAIVETDFVMRLKAREGDEIPLYRVRELILDLRNAGFIFELFSADLRLATADSFQTLARTGIKCEYISLDKTSGPYIMVRDAIYEQRWVSYAHRRLLLEFSNLEKNDDTGKIDHPREVQDVVFLPGGELKDVVLEGAKDIADAVAGSVYNCLRNPRKEVDVEAMNAIMKRIAEKSRERDFTENPTAALFRTSQGKEILGNASTQDTVDKINDVFKRMRRKR